jgi:hypothetical protein
VRSSLTIVLSFQGQHTERSVAEMKRELEAIMRDSGLQVDWRSPREAGQASPGTLVVVRFKGKCVPELAGSVHYAGGPLAYSVTSRGVVMPYSEVDCNSVSASVQSAMRERDFVRADLLLGRALGRVVAHELVHIITKSGDHSGEGVGQAALSGLQLIDSELPLSSTDLERVRERLPSPGALSEPPR